MKRCSSAIALLGAFAAAITFVAPAGASTPVVQAGLPVLGYAEAGTPESAVAASANALAALGIDGVNITSDGAGVPVPDGGSVDLLRQAHARNLRGEILVGNYSDAVGGFDPEATDALVKSQANIDRVVSTLVDAVASQGWDGVHVDLEAIKAEDRDGLVDFVKSLKAALPAGKTVSLAITAFTDAQEYLDNGYDLSALGSALDRIALMAYDQHGPWSEAGPVGGLPWQEEALRQVLARVPADKVDLGVAGYGYTWRPGGGQQVGDSEARAMVEAGGVTAQFDATQGEWTATLEDGTVLWWSDSRSWPLRTALAERYHLHGLAVWSLKLSDPITA